jgi:putative ABC transport system permease protein
LLYNVGAMDPLAFTLAPLVLALAALLATWLPARRATQISPMVALRAE